MSTPKEKFLADAALMSKCIRTCETIDQLITTVDWLSRCINQEVYPDVDMEVVRKSVALLMDDISAQKMKIFGIGEYAEDEAKVDLLSGQVGRNF